MSTYIRLGVPLECIICLDTTKEDVFVHPASNGKYCHAVHETCYKLWNKKECPECRDPVSMPGEVKVLSSREERMAIVQEDVNYRVFEMAERVVSVYNRPLCRFSVFVSGLIYGVAIQLNKINANTVASTYEYTTIIGSSVALATYAAFAPEITGRVGRTFKQFTNSVNGR